MALPTLILHHFETSPFSEKVRLVLGMKSMNWSSVIIPQIMPKPQFTPLTGGNRRTPALQVGADVYCDTRLIVDMLEEWRPEPSIYAGYPEGLCKTITTWAEEHFFWPIARYITGINAEHMGSDFHKDRAAMRGKKAPNLEQVKKAALRNLPDMHLHFKWLQSMLQGPNQFLLGDRLSLADIAVYHGVWYLDTKPISGFDLLAPYPEIFAWMKRVEATGHSSVTEMTAEDALAVARAAEPAPFKQSSVDAQAPDIGSQVTVAPLDYGADPVAGELVYLGQNHVTLLRHADAGLGRMAVHFPRQQYMLRAAPKA